MRGIIYKEWRDFAIKVILGECQTPSYTVLRWSMDNIFVRTDPAGNIKVDKDKSTEMIDGAAATIMALDKAIRCGSSNAAIVYDDREILLRIKVDKYKYRRFSKYWQ